MAKQWLGFGLVLMSLIVLAASGNLAGLPVLLPLAAGTGYMIVRVANRTLLLQGKKR